MSVCGYDLSLPWNEFSAVFQSCFCCSGKAAAAWDFHPYDSYAFNVVLTYDFCQFLAVVAFVQFRTSDQGDAVADKFLMKVCAGVCSTVSSNKEMRTIELWCVDWYQFDLYRPLSQF